MIAFAPGTGSAQPNHARFLAMLPAIVGYARYFLRYLDDEAREEANAEVVANCFTSYVRLVQLGKEDLAYPSVLALYAIKQYRDGRRVALQLARGDRTIDVARHFGISKGRVSQLRRELHDGWLSFTGSCRWRTSNTR